MESSHLSKSDRHKWLKWCIGNSRWLGRRLAIKTLPIYLRADTLVWYLYRFRTQNGYSNLEKTVRLLNMTDFMVAQRVLEIQKLAYRIEADLIGFEGIPPLHETLADLQQSAETFAGYYVDDVLAGVLSYTLINTTLDIGRLVVHPDYFRQGIGRSLVEFAETVSGIEQVIVSTGALNTPACQLYERLGYQLLEEVKLVEGLVIARYKKWLK